MSYLRALSLFIAAFTCLGLAVNSIADDKIKFGKISDEDFAIGAPDKYPEANAIVLVDYGDMEIEVSNFRLDRIVRIKILTKSGIDFSNELGRFEFDFERFTDSVRITSLRESYVCVIDTSQFEQYAVLRGFGVAALDQTLKLHLAK